MADKGEIAKLASVLLSDIEDGSVPLGLLVAKGLHLARLVADDEAIQWLMSETTGYSSAATQVVERYKLLTGRWDGKSENFYHIPASGLVHQAEAMAHSLEIEKQFHLPARTP